MNRKSNRKVVQGARSLSRPAARQPGAAQPCNFEILEERRLLSAGALDTGFGTGGTIIDTSLPAVAHMTVLSNNQILVVGSNTGTTVTVTRYNSDGSIDDTFGTNGSVTEDFGTNGAARNIAVESDGTIVVCGTSNSNVALAAFNANGTVDTSFGTNGFVTTNIGETADADCIEVANNGDLIVAGNAGTADIFAARYSVAGVLDTTFGTNGVSKVTPTRGSLTIYSETIQHGSILLVGQINTGVTNKFLITRLTSSGAPDGSPFGNPDPSATTQWDSLNLIDGNREILAAGSDGSDGALGWYTSSGAIDTAMGDNGEVKFNPGAGKTAQFRQVLDQPDGKILAVGLETTAGSDLSLMAHFNANGTLDTTFGTNGVVTTDFGTSDQEYNDVKEESDGTIIAAGGSPTVDHENIAAFSSDLDLTPPTASLSSVPTVTSNSNSVSLTVTYSDNELIDTSTLGSDNLTITGPHFTRNATLTTVGRERSGGPLTVIYTLAGPFSATTNGTYNVTLNANSVSDNSANFAAGAVLGTFVVNI